MEMMLNKIVPEGLPYRHSCEGPDDMVRYSEEVTLTEQSIYSLLSLLSCRLF
jgi:thiamine phosphate synthase YjbQ (UPF0047 family)